MIVLNGQEPVTVLKLGPPLAGLNDVQRMLALDAMSYLSNNILLKE